MKPVRLAALLAALALLGGCAAPAAAPQRYTATFLTLLDTVTTVLGYAESEEAFREEAQQLHDRLLYYHKLFNI